MPEVIPIHFAPLQGYTEAIYRNAHASCFGGVDTYYTPFVRLEKGNFRHKDVRDIEPEKNSVPHLIPQLIAPSKEKAETILSLFIEKGYEEVNINMGCPFPMLTKRHNGSGILPYPDEVKALLSIVNDHPSIRFSVKMRLGFDNATECMKLVDIINDLPLQQVSMHPRVGKAQYKGDANIEGFAAFYDACKHPLIYNADITSLEDIDRIRERFPKLSGIMIGRGLLANPALALEYKEGKALSTEELKARSKQMHTLVYDEYANQIDGGDLQLLNKMKTFWEYLMPDADRKLLKAIHKSGSLNKYNIAVSSFFSQSINR